jgi:hypothetical protein
MPPLANVTSVKNRFLPEAAGVAEVTISSAREVYFLHKNYRIVAWPGGLLGRDGTMAHAGLALFSCSVFVLESIFVTAVMGGHEFPPAGRGGGGARFNCRRRPWAGGGVRRSARRVAEGRA